MLILRHVAGLTAGQSMPLREGSYQFGPGVRDTSDTPGPTDADQAEVEPGEQGLGVGQPVSVSFGLQVRAEDDVLLVPGREAVSVEGRRVNRPVPVAAGQIVRAGPDQFLLVDASDAPAAERAVIAAPTDPIEITPVPPPERVAGRFLLLLAAAAIVAGVVLAIVDRSDWLALAAAGGVLLLATLWFRVRRGQKVRAAHDQAVVAAKADLAGALLDRRFAVASQRRAQSSGPDRLLQEFDPAPKSASGARLGHVAIALGDTDWEPPTVGKVTAGWDTEDIVKDYASLSSVPYTVDLSEGPLAITGPRRGTLAVGRHVLLAAVQQLGSDRVAIDTTNPADWAWADIHATARLDEAQFVVVDRPGVKSPEKGVAILRDGVVPRDFIEVLAVDATGWATARDGGGAIIATELVPYGVPVEVAAAAGDLPDLEFGDHQPAEAGDTAVDGTAVDEPAEVAAATAESDPNATTVLFTAPTRGEGNTLAATVAIDLSRRRGPESMAVAVIDAGDRPLIRLRQLPQTVAYAAIDDRAGLDAILELVENHIDRDEDDAGDGPTTLLLVVSDLVLLIRHLRRAGQSSQAGRLLRAAAHASDDRLILAASNEEGIEVPPELDAIISSRVVRSGNGETQVDDCNGSRPIQLDQPSGRDLTRAVANIKTAVGSDSQL